MAAFRVAETLPGSLRVELVVRRRGLRGAPATPVALVDEVFVPVMSEPHGGLPWNDPLR